MEFMILELFTIMPPLYPGTSFSNSKSGYLNKGHCFDREDMK